MVKNIISIILFILMAGPFVQAQEVKVTCPRDYVLTAAENIIQAKVEHLSCDNIQVRTDNGKLKRIGDCTYLLIPVRTGDCTISVSKVAGKEVVELGSRTFPAVAHHTGTSGRNKQKASQSKEEVLPIPQPKLLFAGKNGGLLPAQMAIRSGGLQLEETPEVKSGALSLLSYEVMILEREERVFFKVMSEQTFDPEVRSALKQLKEGHMLLFVNVKCRYNNKIIRLDDLIFDIKK